MASSRRQDGDFVLYRIEVRAICAHQPAVNFAFYGLASPIFDFPARDAAVERGDEFFLGESDRLFGLGAGENRQQFFGQSLDISPRQKIKDRPVCRQRQVRGVGG